MFLNGEPETARLILRDLVNAIPWIALKSGDLTLEKKGKKNVFNGRIIEIEGDWSWPLRIGPAASVQIRIGA